jgi:membrane protease subunit HflK
MPDGAAHRPASVTLRAQGQDDTAPALDPANQSLSETLGMVFKVLQISMLVLFGAFALSGFGQIRENESGVLLFLGKPQASNLRPGFQPSFPYPMGELVKVDKGSVALNLDESFWPKLTAEQKNMNLQMLGGIGKGSLKPGDDGSLITGDENLALAQWSVHYTRNNAEQYLGNILTDDDGKTETSIVRAAVERGIVQAVSQTKIDDLLKQSMTDQGSVARRAREIAQRSLDALKSGIVIDQVTLSNMAPPFIIINDFAKVQSAAQEASKAHDDALSQARNELNRVAGEAHPVLIKQIDLYEQAVARGDAPAQDRIMGLIREVLDGKEIKTPDESLRANAVSGEVTYLLADARQYQASIVGQRQAELETFKAKLVQFRSNPNVVVQREWADAMSAFLDKPYVEIFNLSPGSTAEALELWLGRDMSIAKEYEKDLKERAAKKEADRRLLEQQQERLRIRTDQTILKTR